MKTLAFLFAFVCFTAPLSSPAATNSCLDAFSSSALDSRRIDSDPAIELAASIDPAALSAEVAEAVQSCGTKCTTPKVMAHTIANSLQGSLKRMRGLERKARGYAVITAAMVTSAAIGTYLTAELPSQMKFLSILVGNISTLGVYVVGSPIWEPLSDKLRKFSCRYFFAKNSPQEGGFQDPEKPETLGALWIRMQRNYSFNEQMSRNITQSFITGAQLNVHEARRAVRAGDEKLAIDLIAETAVRMRRLFAEILPNDSSVTLAIQSSFARGIEKPEALIAPVMARIREVDREASAPEIEDYYTLLLDNWLRFDDRRSI